MIDDRKKQTKCVKKRAIEPKKIRWKRDKKNETNEWMFDGRKMKTKILFTEIERSR